MVWRSRAKRMFEISLGSQAHDQYREHQEVERQNLHRHVVAHVEGKNLRAGHDAHERSQSSGGRKRQQQTGDKFNDASENRVGSRSAHKCPEHSHRRLITKAPLKAANH